MELETDDESDVTNDLEARKEHDINWTLCHDTRTSCRDIEQNSSQEFYLSLKEREAIRSFYELQTFVKVRRVNILVTERSICQFHDALYYYRNYLYKTDLKEFKTIDREEIF
ncbi:hypothetical protein Goklo_002745 [Gossypium klotzschianum]|uniref:Uncharacterized protein n=1 Tax=Gossypium klotzschianum TaxID=34286 RepID=A0A7J8VUM9_9ROSI|nr:hypothetical protein [Gossypium klotzschianum]